MTIHFGDNTSIDSGGSLGKVVQVVSSSTKTAASQSKSSSGTQSTITDTNLSASITPSSSSNKVLVLVMQSFHIESGSDIQSQWNLFLRDGSNNILHGATGTGESFRFKRFQCLGGYYTLNFLHSPSTTSSFTYKMSMNNYISFQGSSTLFAQKNGTDNNESNITLLEIAA